MHTGHASTPHRDVAARLDCRLAFRKLSGFDPPENGLNIQDHIDLDSGMAAAGGPYAYFLRERSKKLVVKIPAGVREGQFIRLTGMAMKAEPAAHPATCS